MNGPVKQSGGRSPGVVVVEKANVPQKQTGQLKRQESATHLKAEGVKVGHTRKYPPDLTLTKETQAFMALDLAAVADPKLREGLADLKAWLPYAGNAVRGGFPVPKRSTFPATWAALKDMNKQAKGQGASLSPGLAWALDVLHNALGSKDWETGLAGLSKLGVDRIPPPVPLPRARKPLAPRPADANSPKVEERFVARSNIPARSDATAKMMAELKALTQAPQQAHPRAQQKAGARATATAPLYSADKPAAPARTRAQARIALPTNVRQPDTSTGSSESAAQAMPGDRMSKEGIRPLRRQASELVRQVKQGGAQGKRAVAGPKMASVQAFVTMDLAGVREEYTAALSTLQAWLKQLSRYGINEKNLKADQAACAKLEEGLKKGELDGSFAALLTLTEKLATSKTQAAQIFWAAVPPIFPRPEDVSKQRQALAKAFGKIRIFPAPAERNPGAEAEVKRRSLLAISRAAFNAYGPDGARKFNIQDLQFDRKGRMVISYQSRKGTNQLLVEERKGKLAFVEPLKGRLARMSKGARQNVLDRLAQGIQQADQAYALGSEGNEARAKRLFSAISMATDLVAQIPAKGFASFLRATVQDSKYDLSPQGISNHDFRKAYREQNWAAIKALNSSPIPLIEALLVEAGKDIAGIFQGRFTFSQMQEFFSRFSSSGNSWTDLPEGNVKDIGLMLDVFRPDKELVYCICKSLNLFRDQVLATSSSEEMRKLGANLYQMVQALFGFTRERANVEKVCLVTDDSKLNDASLVKPLMLLNADATRAGFELSDQADMWFDMKL